MIVWRVRVTDPPVHPAIGVASPRGSSGRALSVTTRMVFVLPVDRLYRLRLLAVEVERSHHGLVGEAEQEGGSVAAVDVFAEGPGRYREHVLVLPVEPLPAHHGVSGALDHLVVRAADVAIGLGPLAGAQPLDVARDRRHGGAPPPRGAGFED